MGYADELCRVSTFWRPGFAGWSGEEAVTTFHLHHIHFAGNGFDWPTAVQDIADGIADRYNTHAFELLEYTPTVASIVGVKVAHIDSAGHVIDEGIHSGDPFPITGLSSLAMMPPETALCLSQWGYEPGHFSALPGRKRGRFYVPYLTTALLGPDGRVRSDNALTWLGGWQNFLNDVQGMHVGSTIPGSDSDYMGLVAASKVDAEVTQIGWISVDDHWDSQRRRQHQAIPIKQVATISHP